MEEKRHKCTSCGRVRYERFMFTPLRYGGKEPYMTRYGQIVWCCKNGMHASACIERFEKNGVY